MICISDKFIAHQQSYEAAASFIIHKSNSTRENRYSIMIEMNLSAEGLNNFDASEVHKKWKETYGDRLESKAIFDCD